MQAHKIQSKINHVRRLIRDEEEFATPERMLYLEDRLNSLKSFLNDETCSVSVSDHAMIRFIEHSMDIDIDSMRTSLASLMSGKKYIKDGSYEVSKNVWAIVKDRSVITFIRSKKPVGLKSDKKREDL